MANKPQPDMLPVDGEAAVLIPSADMRSDIPGTYGWMKKVYWEAKAKKISTTPGGGSFWTA